MKILRGCIFIFWSLFWATYALLEASSQENFGCHKIYWLGQEFECNFLLSHSHKDIAPSCTTLAKKGIFNCFSARFWLGGWGTHFCNYVRQYYSTVCSSTLSVHTQMQKLQIYLPGALTQAKFHCLNVLRIWTVPTVTLVLQSKNKSKNYKNF